MESNLGRLMTSANSANSAGLMTSVNSPLRTCSSKVCGALRHKNPDQEHIRINDRPHACAVPLVRPLLPR